MTTNKPGNFISRLFHHKKKSEDKVPAATTTAAAAEPAKPAETKPAGKPTLYVFSASVWAEGPLLALRELGYQEGAVEEKTVNLIEGENFTPEFIRINPAATLPTLVTPDKTYTDTAGSVEWVVLNAPTPGTKSTHQDVIAAVHRENIDPNFSLLSARSQEELDAKRGDVPGTFVRQRQAKLEALAPQSPEDLKSFYDNKLKHNGFLASVYAVGAPEELTTAWFNKSKEHWANVKAFIESELPGFLPESGFIDGATPGEADFHVAAWLARTAGVSGAKIDDVTPLGTALGLTLDPKVVAYFDAWKVRESWRKQYAGGLH